MEFWILPPVSHAGSPELPRSIAVITAACYAWFYIAKIPAKNLTLGNSEHHIADISANGRDDGLIIFVILIIIMCIKNKMCQLALNTAVFTCFHLSGTCTTCCLPVADTGIGRPGAPPLWRHQILYDHTCALTILSKPWTNTNFICARIVIGLFICGLSSRPQATANRPRGYENGMQT